LCKALPGKARWYPARRPATSHTRHNDLGLCQTPSGTAPFASSKGLTRSLTLGRPSPPEGFSIRAVSDSKSGCWHLRRTRFLCLVADLVILAAGNALAILASTSGSLGHGFAHGRYGREVAACCQTNVPAIESWCEYVYSPELPSFSLILWLTTQSPSNQSRGPTSLLTGKLTANLVISAPPGMFFVPK
jgi:hypothetical protein